jgi:hypothetical protein
MHGEAVAHPVTLGLLVDAENAFHGINIGVLEKGIKVINRDR